MENSNEVKDTVSPENISTEPTVEDTVGSSVEEANGPKIVKTDEGSITGQDKCPKCGATDISTNIKTGKLRCNFCRCEFEPQKISGMVEDINNLTGTVIGSGASKIQADAKDIVTLKCSSCGAEVVIDTASATQARCHWCRNALSINQQIPNGSVPDVVLPFGITKDVARAEIEKFVAKRKFYANPKFKQEFTTENIMGVYFPYMVVDVNGHANLSGQGEHLVRTYTRTNGNNRTTYYDADLYNVERDFDITINGLTVESSSDKLNSAAKDKTTNIINSIMPFDIENCVKYNSNYIRGFTSEKRDTNIEDLHGMVEIQCKDIAKFAVNDTLKYYDRGVNWKNQNLDVKGEQWKAAYLPVWLYSYQEVSGNKKLLHYVAVNARTKETMGSVPIHTPKLLLVSFLVEILCFFGFMKLEGFDYRFVILLGGFLYYWIIYSKYRNQGARHKYELETTKEVKNLSKKDDLVEHRRGLTNSRIQGANNTTVSNSKKDVLDMFRK